MRSNELVITIVGPSAAIMHGSLLRSANIYYALKDLKAARIHFLPINSVARLPFFIGKILTSDIVIISGITPWLASIVTALLRLGGKYVIVDVQGSPWYESRYTNYGGILYQLLLYIGELLSYNLSNGLIVASDFLRYLLRRYFHVKKSQVHTVNNSLNTLFVMITDKLRNIDLTRIKSLLANTLKIPLDGTTLLVAPLPSVFISNLLALNELKKIAKSLSKENIKVIVTGVNYCHDENIYPIGYVSYVTYALLLRMSRAILLPYPDNAICSGVRNKVLEAGYLGIPIISTEVGMLHSEAKPWTHYIPLSYNNNANDINELVSMLNNTERIKDIVKNMAILINGKYSIPQFKYSLLSALRKELRKYNKR